jgi:DNA-directed RNA polymerase subunit M/transcription elongation factor TFIIS
MSSSVNTDRNYPAVCPSCEETKGFPYQVRTRTDQPGSIEVKLRCRECNHEWVEVVVSHD